MNKKSWDDLLPEPLLLLSAHGKIIDMNHAALRAFRGLANGSQLHDLANDPAKLDSSLRLWVRSGDFIRGLVVVSSPNGERYTTYGARRQGAKDSPAQVIVRCDVESTANQRFIEITRRVNDLNREVARRQHAESQLFAEKELAQVTLHCIGDAVITTDTEGKVNYLNPIAETLTGWSEAESRGRPMIEVFRIFNEQTREPAENPVARVLAYGHTVGLANHTVLLHRDGTEFAIEDSAAPIRDRGGRLIGAVMVFHDVTHARKLAAKVTHQANHDGLTGLLNRQAFEQRLRNLLEAPGGMDGSHSLLFMDLDQFKVINDTCGHLAGDALLRTLGPVLQGHLRHSDLLARLGGDEFGVLLQDCPVPVAKRIASALKEELEELNFTWDGKPFRVGLSIGQVNFSDSSWSLADLLNAADNACYLAKENGRNRIHLYSSDDQALAHRFRQTQWVGRIREAFEEDRFRLHCQAIVPTSSDPSERPEEDGAHFEVLLRLVDKDGKLVPPMAFIPTAERYNLMVGIDQWVLKTAFSKLAMWGSERVTTCSINLSGASLGDEGFLQFINDCFKRFTVLPQIICFEITETEAIANLANARHIIQSLKTLGCRFSLDDFGSGMSSFGYLKNLPVDYLKIDGTFIKNLANDPIDHAMVAAINNIGHVMGLKTIAEFVESASVLHELLELGVDYVQGYGIAKPEPLETYLANLVNGNCQRSSGALSEKNL
ncbi:EAL domain-containing protein [Marinobacter changyiensis]|uniref:EAL domain-containing protein n=1 Tax=Marinobacter changyiensis TaxID=2604091 RepID=UPI001264F05E|nr:EAL domain-containing protein [Marinobacter changyiensis]